MGASGVDVLLSSTAKKAIPYAIECKSRGKLAVYEMFDQAESNANTLQPLLIIKADRKRPLVVMDADHFFNLIQNAWRYREPNQN